MPKSRVDFWQGKFNANVARDKLVANELAAAGWRVMTIWECETKNADTIAETLADLSRD